jgi:uncharacterized Ntn-hydrolase superfamily protein
MTYSIVARDLDSGEFGVAVQSHYFSVGSGVPWAEAGVGAVATQAQGEISYGPRGLAAMRVGKSSTETLADLLAADERSEVRQVAMVDASGNVAAHTGGNCIPYAGDLQGAGVSVQANMMERETVPAAMRSAYETTSGTLAERLMAALDAAEAEGGDIRGRQSAAMVITGGTRKDEPWEGIVLELRVEDHPEPLAELRRLARLHRAYSLVGEAEKAAAEGDISSATTRIAEAMQLAPGNAEIAFWAAMGSAEAGQIPMARQLLEQATAVNPRWKLLISRLPRDTFPLSAETIEQLTAD